MMQDVMCVCDSVWVRVFWALIGRQEAEIESKIANKYGVSIMAGDVSNQSARTLA